MVKINKNRVCKNCLNEFDGKYCNLCGQVYFDEFKTSFIFKNIIDVFEFEIGYLLTFKSIYTEKDFINRYILGKTQKYTNPVRFLFICLIIVSILETLTRFYFKSEMDNWIPFIPNEYITYLPLIIIFYIVLFLFYRKTSSNIKLIIATIYLFSIYTILDTFYRIAYLFGNEIINMIVFIFVIFNMSYIISNNFTIKKYNKRYSILSFIIYWLSSSIIFDFFFDFIQ